MFENFLQLVTASITSFFILVSSPFTGNTTTNIAPSPSPIPAPTVIQQTMVKAAGTYSFENRSVNVVMEFPQDGGTVKGSLDGDCNGTIDGQYAGGEDGALTAKADANCGIAFFTINATADLLGKVSLIQKKIAVTFNGKAGDYSHNGAITLNFVDSN